VRVCCGESPELVSIHYLNLDRSSSGICCDMESCNRILEMELVRDQPPEVDDASRN
jgi:hypothetical protein